MEITAWRVSRKLRIVARIAEHWLLLCAITQPPQETARRKNVERVDERVANAILAADTGAGLVCDQSGE